LNPKSSD